MTTSRLYTGAARALDGIPVVTTTAARNARYPSPPEGFRVDNQETNVIERYVGGAWRPVDWTIGAVNVKSEGAVGDGTTDDTTAIQAAIAAAGEGGCIYFPDGLYRTTAALTVTDDKQVFTGPGRIYKSHTGDAVQVSADYVTWDLWIEGNVGSSTTYGTSGAALHFTPSSSAYGFVMTPNAGITQVDSVLLFESNAAHAFRATGCFLSPYTITPGAEPDAVYVKGDSSAGFRQFANVFLLGKFRLDGAQDTYIVSSALRTITTDDSVAILTVQGSVFANNGNPHTFKGTTLAFTGCRFSGSVTLAANSTGTWAGNMFTSGSLTDSSGGYSWMIHHRTESSALVSMVDGHLLRRGFAGVLTPNSTVLPGDAAVSTQTTATPTARTIIFNTPLTADRAVTLNTGADYKDGDSYHIVRTAAATGAFNVNVGSGPLKALAAGTWCIVVYRGGGNWTLAAYGSL